MSPGTKKRYKSIESLRLPIATHTSKNAKQIDPKRVDAIASTIGHKCWCFFLRQIGDQVLRRVPDHQERSIVLVDEIAVVAACLERIDGAVRRSKYSDVCPNVLRQRARHRRQEYGYPQKRSGYRMRKAFSCRACVAPDPKRYCRVQHSDRVPWRAVAGAVSPRSPASAAEISLRLRAGRRNAASLGSLGRGWSETPRHWLLLRSQPGMTIRPTCVRLQTSCGSKLIR